MTNQNETQRMEAAAEEHWLDNYGAEDAQVASDSFKAGWQAKAKDLATNASVEWDKEKAIDQAKHEDSDGYFGFLTGSEWQHQQTSAAYEAKIAELVELLDETRGHAKQMTKHCEIFECSDTCRQMVDDEFTEIYLKHREALAKWKAGRG